LDAVQKRTLGKAAPGLKRPVAAPVATPAEVFAAIIAVREKLARNEKRHLRCFVGKEVRRSGLRNNLPRSRDGDFVGYRKRVRRSSGGKRFGLVIVDYPDFDVQIQRRIEQFLRPLKVAPGPRIKSKTLLFVGDYERTPVGIHKDPHGTFVFVIEGRKRFRTWPSDFFPADKGTGRLRYRQFLPDAITLEGAAGDLIYWPSSYWHIGEPLGGFSISLNVGVFPPG
jgi:hypothetical protein